MLQDPIPNSEQPQTGACASITTMIQRVVSVISSTAIFESLSDPLTSDIRDGRAWAMAETLRSICLQGL